MARCALTPTTTTPPHHDTPSRDGQGAALGSKPNARAALTSTTPRSDPIRGAPVMARCALTPTTTNHPTTTPETATVRERHSLQPQRPRQPYLPPHHAPIRGAPVMARCALTPTTTTPTPPRHPEPRGQGAALGSNPNARGSPYRPPHHARSEGARSWRAALSLLPPQQPTHHDTPNRDGQGAARCSECGGIHGTTVARSPIGYRGAIPARPSAAPCPSTKAREGPFNLARTFRPDRQEGDTPKFKGATSRSRSLMKRSPNC